MEQSNVKFGRERWESIPGVGILRAWGDTVPTDGESGYAPSCHFQKIDGTTLDTVLYVNIGTLASCDFDAALLAT